MKFLKIQTNNSLLYAVKHFWNYNLLIWKFTLTQELNRIKSFIEWVKSRSSKQWLLAGASSSFVILIGLAGMSILFLNPHSLTYSFSDDDNCFLNPIVLPNTFKSAGTENFDAKQKPKISLGSTPLISTTTCLQITTIPESSTKETLQIKSPATLQKNITLVTEELPVLTPYESLSQPISTDAVLLFDLNKNDKTFEYNLQIDEKTTDCVLHDTLLGCPLSEHKLAQGQKYSYEINRLLVNQNSEALSGDLTTLDPVSVLSSSIGQNENVFSKPNLIEFTTSKSLKSVGEVSLKSADGQNEYDLEANISDTKLTLSFDSELPRNTGFTLSISNLISTDGASLSAPYELNFKTSSGPQLQSVSVGNYKVNPSSSIKLTFDVELDSTQPIENIVGLTNSAGAVPSNITIQNNSITINPTNNLDACTSYTISVNDSLTNKYGVSGNSKWSMQTRTTCQQSFSIGSSVQGRSITAYKFGNGPTKIVYVGGIHGNEKSSVATMQSWIDDLERNYQNIPSDKTIIVIPNASPDGYVLSSRLNANRVDLNRNFPSNNWQSGVYIPGNVYLENGGGVTPLSEPEASALANYLINSAPRLVLTYHATGGFVVSNGAKDSANLSSVYAQKSGYSNYTSEQEDSLFSYSTTGELEDWLRDKRNVPTLLVELRTVSSNNFNNQKSAMWAMLSQ